MCNRIMPTKKSKECHKTVKKSVVINASLMITVDWGTTKLTDLYLLNLSITQVINGNRKGKILISISRKKTLICADITGVTSAQKLLK